MNLREFVEKSSLLKEDKNLWFSVLEGLNEEEIKILEDFIGPVRDRARADAPEGPTGRAISNGVNSPEENLKELTENFKAKRKAFKDLDEKALEEIVEKEK